MPIVFGFDLGTGSLAAAIRKDDKIVWKRSFIMPGDLASTKPQAQRRRAARTRNAHRAREHWWNMQCEGLGIPLLKKFRKNSMGEYRVIPESIDARLLREFPKKGDETIYNSALLRIKILEGQVSELEDWQIYKAVHSAIQKRGYDPKVAWIAKTSIKPALEIENEPESSKVKKKSSLKKTASDSSIEKKNDDTEEVQKNLDLFVKHLAELGLPEKFHKCSYFDAYKMNLWSPETGIKSIRVDHLASQAAVTDFKGYTPPRQMVEEEIRQILIALKAKYPSLDPDYVLYGETKIAYGSYFPKIQKLHQVLPGRESDWHGLLGQKIPRFDNRIIDKCLLIPRFNVAKKKSESKGPEKNLFYEFDVAWALHFIKVSDQISASRSLVLEEFKKLFQEFKDPEHRMTKTRLESELKKMGLSYQSGRAEVDPPREGRSGFSKVAARQLLEMLLKGYSPKEYKKLLLSRPISPKSSKVTIEKNLDPTKGLVPTDLKWLDEIIDKEWNDFYLPQIKYQKPYEAKDTIVAVRELLSNVNNPVITHRLKLLGRTIDEMAVFIQRHFGVRAPDNVCLELVRDDFIGPKKKKEIAAMQRNRADENLKFIEEAKELGLEGKKSTLKLRLWHRQNHACLYTGRPIGATEIESCEIDHVYPESMGGPDSEWNYILTFRDVNKDQKRDQTPYEWLSGNKEAWKEFSVRLKLAKISNKTRRICLEENVSELIDRYTHIAETAHIAKLAVGVINLKFGWLPHTMGDSRKVITVAGNVTASVRKRYKLDGILSPEEDLKNRDDNRHHMLDAMVLTYLPGWLNDKSKRERFALPKGVEKSYFEELLKSHLPLNIQPPSEIEEHFYGRKDSFVTRRNELADAAFITVQMKKKFAPETFSKWLGKLKDSNLTHPVLLKHLIKLEASIAKISDSEIKNGSGEEQWLKVISQNELPNGTIPKKIKTYASIHAEYRSREHGAHATKGYIKPKGSHKGFLICEKKLDPKKKKSDKKSWEAIAIYAWESIYSKTQSIKSEGRDVRCFVRSGDYIEVRKSIGNDIPKGYYRLSSLMNGRTIMVTSIARPELKVPGLSVTSYIEEGDFMVVEAGAEVHL